jgi:hypothetical protein
MRDATVAQSSGQAEFEAFIDGNRTANMVINGNIIVWGANNNVADTFTRPLRTEQINAARDAVANNSGISRDGLVLCQQRYGLGVSPYPLREYGALLSTQPRKEPSGQKVTPRILTMSCQVYTSISKMRTILKTRHDGSVIV